MGSEQGLVHVLVIEDERDVSALLERHLGGLGCRVTVADTGEEGLELAFAEPPDMVIIDVLLPGIDGREVIRRLRADERTKRCHLVVSSVLNPEDLVELATDELLAKPFRQPAVARLVDSYRNRSSVSQEE
ncbi:response regulator [Streptomyces ureilyticus]|uniref:Response regulator transcription factor n=1 Tax=Streptomyces ureilyticus TaxID=1775131 RepID=A0ABX0DRQ0_9ACTN|nr:response regulator [Streptomyces ureilyticus]NGO43400.1 response regulator transcription factor [Streptomyces ureilyticus]